MWARKRVDIGWSDLAYGFIQCLRPGRKGHDAVRSSWTDGDNCFVSLSVRSSLDLLFQARNLPPGSEVLMSALTIPGMIDVVRHHQLVPVPVDLNPETLAPDPGCLYRAITSRSRVLIVAHLFGDRLDLSQLTQIAHQHNILVVADCAQAFDGTAPQELNVDMALYSFGPIKTATALGGAIAQSGDTKLIGRMKEIQDSYPVRSRLYFMKRSMKYILLKWLGGRLPFSALVKGLTWAGKDYDKLLKSIVRGFRGKNLIEQLRFQPPEPMTRLLARRLTRFDFSRQFALSERAQWLRENLPVSLTVPGSQDHQYWVFPICSSKPKSVMEALREAGFDTTQYSGIVVVDTPENHPCPDPEMARRALQQIVFAPVYPDMPWREVKRMGSLLQSLDDPKNLQKSALQGADRASDRLA